MDNTSITSVSLSPTAAETVKQPVAGKRRWLAITSVSALLLLTSLVLAFHAYIAWTLANPHIDALKSNPLKAFGAAYEDIHFPSHNGKTELSGWYIPGTGSKSVVFSHGYGGNREEIWVPIYSLAGELHKRGYNVLMFDYGYVNPNQMVTGGVQESQELLGAIDYVRSRNARQVYVWGFSMGAGTALQAALQTKSIDGMILDSTFLLDPETLYHNMKQYVNLPKYPSLPLVKLFFPLVNGVNLQQIPSETVKETKYPIPIFFIHGKEDTKAPYEIVESIFANQKRNLLTRLWLLPTGEHEWIYQANKKSYMTRTMNFLDELSSGKPSFKLTPSTSDASI